MLQSLWLGGRLATCRHVSKCLCMKLGHCMCRFCSKDGVVWAGRVVYGCRFDGNGGREGGRRKRDTELFPPLVFCSSEGVIPFFFFEFLKSEEWSHLRRGWKCKKQSNRGREMVGTIFHLPFLHFKTTILFKLTTVVSFKQCTCLNPKREVIFLSYTLTVNPTDDANTHTDSSLIPV